MPFPPGGYLGQGQKNSKKSQLVTITTAITKSCFGLFFFFRERQPFFPLKTKTNYSQTHATKEEEAQKNQLKPKAGVSS